VARGDGEVLTGEYWLLGEAEGVPNVFHARLCRAATEVIELKHYLMTIVIRFDDFPSSI
jgi:hypothetical protein